MREDRVQCGDGFRRELRKRDAVLERAVRSEQRRSAAIGNDREPISLRNAAHRQDPRCGEKLRVGLHADRAGPSQRGIEHGVGGRLALRFQRSARLQHDDGLRPRRGTQGRQECARVAGVLDIKENAAGSSVEQQKIEQLAEADVDAAAQRDHRGKADAKRRREVEHRRADRT